MNFTTKVALCALLGIMLFSSCDKEHDHNDYYLPGEWEEQSSVWMGSPTYENKAGLPTQAVQAEMINALAPHVLIDIAVQDEAEKASLTAEYLSYGVSQQTIDEKVRFHVIPHNDIWWRDMGSIFLKKDDSEFKMVDFNFNGWGYAQYTDAFGQSGFALDETVDREMAAELNLPTVSTQMILEGGSIESNGKGTIIVTESVVFQRNPNMSKVEAEAELKRVLNAKKVIWLPRGVGNDVNAVEGSPYNVNGENVYTPVTTNGHTDEFVRFVNDHTLLLAEVPEIEATDTIAKFSRKALLEAESILSNATDQDGHPFTIIRIPETGTIIEEVQAGDGTFDFLSTLSPLNLDPAQPIKIVWASSYLNYVISNGVLLMPKYAALGRPANLAAKDAQAFSVLQAAFPDRQIVQIDAMNINLGGGGMHCITQQVPK